MGYKRLREKILDPDGQFIPRCFWILMITFSVCLFVDPLFFYLPAIGMRNHNICIDFNHTMRLVLSVLRSGLDILYFLCLIPCLLIIRKHITRIRFYVGVILNVFFYLTPVPQLLSSSFVSPSGITMGFMWIILVTNLSRLFMRIKLNEGLESIILVPMTSWPAAANSLYYCILASHVVGSSWYFLSLNSVLRCCCEELNISWIEFEVKYAVSGAPGGPGPLFATVGDPRLNDSFRICMDPNIKHFNHGIFIQALTLHVVESSMDFFKRFLYCFWWGLRNISSLGQNLEESTSNVQTIFAVSISFCGLVLFTLLLGNIQNYHQSVRKKWKDAEVERSDTEMWMLRQELPRYLRNRIRLHELYKWQKTKFVDEETVLRNLPKEIRRDVKRHLCLALLTKVPQFERSMDSYLLDALCDRLKPVLYIKKTCILHEGKPIEEMIFIKRGNLEIMAKNCRRTDFLTSSNLKDGDFCGEELVTWALDPHSSSRILPISTRTVKTISVVEAYALMADDLKLIASQLHTKQLYESSRLHEEEPRTLAAFKIQKAWFRYKKSNMERSLLAAEARPQSALGMAAGTSSLAITIHASRFATKILRSFEAKRRA